MERVLFVTNFSKEKKKARLLYEVDLLKSKGYQVEVEYFEGKYSLFTLILTYLSLKFFNFHQVFQSRRRSKDFDHVVLYGLQTLPSVLFIAPEKNVIYQTLDDNVSYTIYELTKRLFLIGLISRLLEWVMRKVERGLSRKAKTTLVNSTALNDYLSPSILNYYTSPFENLKLEMSPNNPFAVLYLGQLKIEKGTSNIKRLCEEHSMDCHFFGIPVDDETREFVKEDYVRFYGNLDFEELKNQLGKLSGSLNLIGTSLIETVHRSYETQEANKDIDYMAMGIPFVGNRRGPTYDKVKLGCGVLEKDFSDLLNFTNYLEAAKKSKLVYQEMYSNEKFKRTFLSCFSSIPQRRGN